MLNHPKLHHAFALVIFISGPLVTPRPVHAADGAWINPAGGNFNDGANWNTGAVPGPTDNAVIALDGTYTVTLNAFSTVRNLILGGASGKQLLNSNGWGLTVAGNAEIGPTGVLGLNGGSIKSTTMATLGVINWSEGTLQSTCEFNPNSQLNLLGNSGKSLAGIINNAGAINWTGTGTLSKGFSTAATVNNLAGSTLKIQLPSGGETSLRDIVFKNAGILNVLSGKFNYQGGVFSNIVSANTGEISLATGSLLNLASGAFQLNAGSLVGGGGTLRVSGSELQLNTPLDAPHGLELASGKISGTGSVRLGNGVNCNWTSGDMMGPGTVEIATGGTLNVSQFAGKHLLRTINNSGTISLTGDNANIPGGVGAVINNQGLFKAAAPAGHSTGISNVVFNNTGTLSALSGNFGLAGDAATTRLGTNTGTFNSAANAFINLDSGTYVFGTGALITGSGATRETGANLLVNGVTRVTGVLQLEPLGKIGGTSSLNVAKGGKFNWRGGVLQGSGAVNILSGGTLAVFSNFGKTLHSTINNNGLFTWTEFPIIGADLGHKGTINNLTGGIFNTRANSTDSLIGIDLNNYGVLNPGGPGGVGTIDMSSDVFTQGPSGVLNLNLGGISGSSFGQLNMIGLGNLARLGGTLHVAAVAGFRPGSSSKFRIMSFAQRNGTTFAHVSSLSLQPIYHPTEVLLAGPTATVNLVARPALALSSVSASSETASIQLGFSAPLDPIRASDPDNYTVLVNGGSATVESAAYDSVNHRVTLALKPGSLRSGDQMQVQWRGGGDGAVVMGQSEVMDAR